VAVGGVDHDHVDAGVDQRPGPLVAVVADPDRRRDPQPARVVLGRVRELFALGEVLDRDQAPQPATGVDDRQLLDLVSAQQPERGLLVDPDLGGDQRHLGHHVADQRVLVGHEPHVAVGHDPDQGTVGVGHRHPGDPVPAAERVHLTQGGVRRARDRVGDHARLGPLHQVDLGRLVVDRQVAVQCADAALARHRDRHPGLGDRVHRAGDQRDVQPHVAGQLGGGVDATGDDIGLPGQ